MNVFLLPSSVCNDIERMFNAFWWNKNNGQGVKWTSWNRLCSPKTAGGLGFKNLKIFNLAMLGKQGWCFLKHPDALVAQLFKAKYFKDVSFLNAPLSSNPSFVWRSI